MTEMAPQRHPGHLDFLPGSDSDLGSDSNSNSNSESDSDSDPGSEGLTSVEKNDNRVKAWLQKSQETQPAQKGSIAEQSTLQRTNPSVSSTPYQTAEEPEEANAQSLPNTLDNVRRAYRGRTRLEKSCKHSPYPSRYVSSLRSEPVLIWIL